MTIPLDVNYNIKSNIKFTLCTWHFREDRSSTDRQSQRRDAPE